MTNNGYILMGVDGKGMLTKPCPDCGKLMIEVDSGVVTASIPPFGSLFWRCYGCGHIEHSRLRQPEYRDYDRERWQRANGE